MGIEIFSKEDQAAIDELQMEIEKLDHHKQLLERRITEIKTGQSPIKVGMIIQWESGKNIRRGRVRKVCTDYRGFSYHCDILAKDGRSIGHALVNSDRCPLLVDEGTQPQ